MKILATIAQSNSSDDNARGLANLEYQSLIEQVNALTNQTRFNGAALIDGNGGNPTTAGTYSSFQADMETILGATAHGGAGTMQIATGTLTAAQIEQVFGKGVVEADITTSDVISAKRQYDGTGHANETHADNLYAALTTANAVGFNWRIKYYCYKLEFGNNTHFYRFIRCFLARRWSWSHS